MRCINATTPEKSQGESHTILRVVNLSHFRTARVPQARILKHAFAALKKKRRSLHIKRVLWFNFRDPGGGNVKTCSFCSSAGLLEHDATPKPAWSAFRSFTR